MIITSSHSAVTRDPAAGKSLALLRLVCPHHHLAGRHRALQPRLQLAVTAEQQEELQQSCRRWLI